MWKEKGQLKKGHYLRVDYPYMEGIISKVLTKDFEEDYQRLNSDQQRTIDFLIDKYEDFSYQSLTMGIEADDDIHRQVIEYFIYDKEEIWFYLNGQERIVVYEDGSFYSTETNIAEEYLLATKRESLKSVFEEIDLMVS